MEIVWGMEAEMEVKVVLTAETSPSASIVGEVGEDNS